MVTDKDEDRYELTDRGGFLVRRAHQIWSAQIQKSFREAGYDITSVQFAALDIVVRFDGLDQTDLALRIGYDRATVGGVIVRLERDGYITREAHPTDRRARVLVSTDKGRAAAARLAALARDADAQVTASIDIESRKTLFRALEVLIETGNNLDVAPPFRASGRAETEAATSPKQARDI